MPGRFILPVLVVTLLPPTSLRAAVSAPVLKWKNGGCFASWCQTGWYSSPAVVDLDGDGAPDVVWGSYDVVALNGANGTLKWRAPGNNNRVWPGIAIADLTGNGTPEVIVGRSGDQVTVYDRFGGVVWTRNPFGYGEVRTLAVSDLDGDGQLEVIAGRAGNGDTLQLNVFEPDGSVRPGWPARHDGEPGNGWGMYNENVAVADMNGDGLKEIFGPTDTHTITALDRNGNQLPVNSRYTGRTFWSEVGVHVSDAVDVRGYAFCGTEHRPNFADSAPTIADVDGDGVPELVVVGNVYNCGTSPYTDLYHMPFIFNLDRTRWNGGPGRDWTAIPPDPGAGGRPLSEDYNVIESAVPNAVIADLDGDGIMEILYASYDGKVHAYWLDKTQHGSWPYTVPTAGLPGDNFRFASEPVVADLDNDGKAEVIFTSWPKKGTGGVGQLHILNYLGVELYRVNLPPALGGGENGGLGAPTLANIDADPDLEVVVGTIASGVVAYRLPNTANARILWGTGRGGYRRAGTRLPSVSINDIVMAEGTGLTTSAVFTVTLSAPSGDVVTVPWATAPGTAVGGGSSGDYADASGTLAFPPGTTSRTITVGVNGDAITEPNEYFYVNLGPPTGANIARRQGVATILNDDPPAIVIRDASVVEGTGGTTAAVFTVALSVPTTATVSVAYATAPGTAVGGPAGDYTDTSGTVTFPPGVTSRVITVPINPDAVPEPNETFVVNLGSPVNATIADGQGLGTIIDDDTALGFYTLAPCRLADTRNPNGPSGGPALAANAARNFPAAGRCGIPADARAVALIVTTVSQTDFGDLRLYPADSPLTGASTLNFAANHVRANNAVISLGTAGGLGVQCDLPPGSTGSTHALIDVFGYFK